MPLSVTGDIIEIGQLLSQYEKKTVIIVHGCNCRAIMGAGLALQLAKMWPSVARTDKVYNGAFENKQDLLGRFSITTVDDNLKVANLYTQLEPWAGTLEYDAIGRALSTLKTVHKDSFIVYPMIGAGLAGGDWYIISNIIEGVLGKNDNLFVEYSPPEYEEAVED